MPPEAQNSPSGATAATAAPPRPPLRERLRTGRWLGLTARDLAACTALIIVTSAGTWLLLTLQRRLPPERQLAAEVLLIIWATLMGATMTYTVLRRLISDLGLGNRALVELSHQAIGESRSLIDEARAMIENAYITGHARGRGDWQALADAAAAAQQRITDLEHQLAERRLPMPADAASLARLHAVVERVSADLARLDRKAEDLPAQVDQLDRYLAEVQAEVNALRRHVKLDAMDEWMLALYRRDPKPTDKEVSKITHQSMSTVLKRRNRLAAYGYAAAQKRQGQRPRSRA